MLFFDLVLRGALIKALFWTSILIQSRKSQNVLNFWGYVFKNPGIYLVSWDVVSMFPNIDNELGLGAVKRTLETRDHLLPSTSCILEAVEICLKCNHSVFDDKFYLQIHGTAMGPKNSCSYADLAMGEIDHKAKFCGPIRPSQW